MKEHHDPPAPFYLVWREGGGTPTFKHDDERSAAAEASRLARNNPGETFHVLVVIESAVVNPVTWINYQHDELPF